MLYFTKVKLQNWLQSYNIVALTRFIYLKWLNVLRLPKWKRTYFWKNDKETFCFERRASNKRNWSSSYFLESLISTKMIKYFVRYLFKEDIMNTFAANCSSCQSLIVMFVYLFASFSFCFCVWRSGFWLQSNFFSLERCLEQKSHCKIWVSLCSYAIPSKVKAVFATSLIKPTHENNYTASSFKQISLI